MSAPVRFLSVAVLAWAGVRAATLGALPGFTVSYAKAIPPAPIVATDLQSPIALAGAVAEPAPALPWAEAPQYAPAQYAFAPPVIRPAQYYQPAYSPMPAGYHLAPIAPRPDLEPCFADGIGGGPVRPGR